MISGRFLKYSFFALMASAFVVEVPLAFRGAALSPVDFILGVLFGIAFHSIVVVRLPIFREYYRDDPFGVDGQYRIWANQKAAPVMSGVLVWGITYSVWMLVGVGDNLVASFSAAIAAGAVGMLMPLPS